MAPESFDALAITGAAPRHSDGPPVRLSFLLPPNRRLSRSSLIWQQSRTRQKFPPRETKVNAGVRVHCAAW